jgi:hypothetical protein
MEALICKQCGAAIPEENIINDGRIAVYSFCDTVHDLSEETLPFPEKQKRQEKQKRSIPDKFIFEQHPEGVELRYRWLSKLHWGLLFFTILWDGFMVVWISIALATGAWIMIVFGSLHIAVGAGLAYFVLTGFINKTSIMIQGQGLEITHSPIPAIGTSNKIIDRRAIEQVYCTRRVGYTSNNVPHYVFDVHYIEKGGGDETLVKGLDDLNEAIFIEQQIERIYHIEDRPVDDEYKSRYI